MNEVEVLYRAVKEEKEIEDIRKLLGPIELDLNKESIAYKIKCLGCDSTIEIERDEHEELILSRHCNCGLSKQYADQIIKLVRYAEINVCSDKYL